MGVWVHRVSDVDACTCLGTCAECGPSTRMVRHENRWCCSVARSSQMLDLNMADEAGKKKTRIVVYVCHPRGMLCSAGRLQTPGDTVKIMVARYSGKCATCHGAIKAGTPIAFGGRLNTHHALCTDQGRTAASADAHECNVTCAHDGSPTAVYSTRNSGTHATVDYGRNRHGRARCIDAPCCGCC